ncbi:MAG TPA: FeoB-associated Cys-rich membrane protein [Synergistaceae bacterium]|jgi:hypothetical protein|nr:FeoB-associated Cys-rich membrane protein [Synergistaceae bacterium]HPJ26101.1 FeoB-associated Cys-rich membrane protein [Synergistaceae bacterium]
MQTLIVVAIVVLSAIFLGRTLLKSAREGTCPGGCGGCSQSGKCPGYVEKDFVAEEKEK